MRKPATRAAAVAGLALLCFLATLAPLPAQAQSLFDFLFGPRHVRPALPPPFFAYGPTERDSFDRRRGDAFVGGPHFCVRLCDGRFFPVTKPPGNATPIRLCRALCPASPTKVVSGRSIETAYGADGKSYSDLPNAYVFRDKVVPDCTCNGKSPLGLARIEVEDDPTLQQGDIVASGGSLLAYTGASRSRAAGAFTPIENASVLPRRLRAQLEHTPVGE